MPWNNDFASKRASEMEPRWCHWVPISSTCWSRELPWRSIGSKFPPGNYFSWFWRLQDLFVNDVHSFFYGFGIYIFVFVFQNMFENSFLKCHILNQMERRCPKIMNIKFGCSNIMKMRSWRRNDCRSQFVQTAPSWLPFWIRFRYKAIMLGIVFGIKFLMTFCGFEMMLYLILVMLSIRKRIWNYKHAPQARPIVITLFGNKTMQYVKHGGGQARQRS